ncbi:hypothetical protein D9M68_880270 [compost metagenome]
MSLCRPVATSWPFTYSEGRLSITLTATCVLGPTAPLQVSREDSRLPVCWYTEMPLLPTDSPRPTWSELPHTALPRRGDKA